MTTFVWSTDNECEDCGMSWDDPNHQTRQAICDECGADCGYELCAEDHAHIVCEDCTKENYN